MIQLLKLLVAAVSLAAFARAQAPPSPQDVAFFAREVRPVLERRCVRCHGNGAHPKGGLRLTHRDFVLAGGQEGPAIDLAAPGKSLLLDMLSYRDEHHRMPPAGKLPDQEIALLRKWIERGAPWTPGPPPEVADPGPTRLVKGDGREGWAYRPVMRPKVPEVRDRAWVQSDLDAFILRGLERNGLSPAPRADAVALIRRATHDLTGLPATPEEIDGFLADDRPDAFARVVDRLLASPHYGERWGRHWLDLVRYAETNGYERDSNKPFIWRYRDWVINAFNADKPYDRMILEQLAGDELDDVTPETLVATGYHRLMIWDDEPGAGRLQHRYDVLDDIVSTTGQVFLGMTLGCARCHDHKGDAISQADYYEFMAFFHGVTDMSKGGFLVPITTPEEEATYQRALATKKAEETQVLQEIKAFEDAFQRKLLAKDDRAGRGSSDLRGLRYRFYRDTWSRLPDFDALRPEDEGTLEHGYLSLAPATRRDAVGFVFTGDLLVPENGTWEFEVRTRQPSRLRIGDREVITPETRRERQVARGRLELRRGTVPLRLDYFNRGAGEHGLEVAWRRVGQTTWRYTTRKPAPGWTTSEFSDADWNTGAAGFGTRGTPGASVRTVWSTSDIWLRRTFAWTGDPKDLTLVAHHDEDVEIWINGVRAAGAKGYRTDYRTFAPSEAARSALRPGQNVLAVHCRQTGGGQYVHVAPIPRDRLRRGRLRDAAFGVRRLSVGSATPQALKRLIERRGPEVLTKAERRHHRELRRRLDRVRRRRIPRKMAAAVQESGPRPKDLHVHIRGNAQSLGRRVEPAFPDCLNPPAPRIPKPAASARTSGRRRALAEWIASPENPLTARVMANRLWQFHFGRGLVTTPNDFGELGERPSHPELLDWLASELVAGGWKLKRMHRLIMLSSAWQMSTRADPKALEKDPANRQWWRFDLRRLSAEEVRDGVLAVSGRLNRATGGPSVYVPMPKAVLATSSTPTKTWGRSSVEDASRRSVYIKVKRSLITPILSSFDLADTDASCAARFRTTTPNQALSLLNGDFVNEQARVFAARLEKEAGPRPEDRVRRALRLVLGRRPEAQEVRDHVRFLADLERDFARTEKEALEAFCLVALNLNEFLYLN